LSDHASISSPIEVPQQTIQLWQSVVDLMADMFDVPAGLIMRITNEDIEVFIASAGEENPYDTGDRERLLDSGLYCEEVLKTNDMLIVPNALESEKWENNPDIALGMISYLGYPIKTPDGGLFGTICVLDRKNFQPSETYIRLMGKFRDMIEMDLIILSKNIELDKKNIVLENKITEFESIELELRNSEEREKELADVVRSAPVAIAFGYPDGRLAKCNTAFAKLTGYTHEELRTIDWSKTLTPSRWNRIETEKLNELNRTGKSVLYEKEYIRKDGSVVPIELYVTKKLDDSGNLLHYIAFITDISERKGAESAIQEREHRLRSISDNLPAAQTFQMMVTPDGQSKFTYVSNAVNQLHECTVEEALADPSKLFGRVVEEDLAGLQKAAEESIREMRVYDHEVRIRRKSGEIRWHRMISRPRKTEENAILFDGIDLDITKQKLTEIRMEKLVLELNERVKELNCLYRISELVRRPDISMREIIHGILELIPQSWQYPDNTCARIILEGQEFRTQNFRETTWKLHSEIVAAGIKSGVLEVFYLEEKPDSYDGPFLEEEVKLIKIIADRLGESIEFHDTQDELIRKNAQLEMLATHDYLTGLPNRMLFYDRFSHGLMMSKRKNTKMMVCIADVDNFKKINDMFGHQCGDNVLKEIASRAKSALREYDTLARLGGDEFSILILDIETRHVVEKIMERTLRTVNQELTVCDQTIQPSISIGVSIYPDHGDTHEQLIQRADRAMYEAKGKGKNRFIFYGSDPI